MEAQKVIIFDWGRTLYDNEEESLFPEANRVLTSCKSRGYRMALLSVSKDPSLFEFKKKKIAESGIDHFFEKVVISTQKEKEEVDEIVTHFGVPYQSILMVGDRTAREIRIANKLGMRSIWIQKGKFSDELPDWETGEPTHTVTSLGQIIEFV